LAARRSNPAPLFSAFISHAKADAKKAQAIAEGLEARGFRCWIAPRDVKAGRSYGDEIIRGIESAKTFVLVLSKASNESAFVAREVERAVSKKKPVLAVRLANVEPAPSLELFVSSTQWIDAFPGKLEPHIGRLAERLAEEEGVEPVEPEQDSPKPSRLPKWVLPAGAAASALLVIGAGLALWPERHASQSGPESRGTEMIVGAEPAGGSALPSSFAGAKNEAPNPSPLDLGDADFRACEKSSGADGIAACDRAIASGKFTGRSLSYLYNDRGFMLMQKGAIEAALVDLNKAIGIDSANFYAYWNRGAISAAKRDFDGARADFTTALALDPDQTSKAKIQEALTAVVAGAGAADREANDPSVIADPSRFWGDPQGSAAATAPAYPADAFPASPAVPVGPPAMAVEPPR
jgi:tetratricopeptide (TPR) repeat protein